MPYDVEHYRKDFPLLDQKIYGKPLVYFDNAATTQKPNSVIQSINDLYTNYNSNIHRGVHTLSNKCTDAYENARKKVQAYINAKNVHEVVFTKGATESINLLANTFGNTFLKSGDEVVISTMEHHSNIVPWQLLEMRIGIKLRVVPITQEGELIMDEYNKLLNGKTKLVSITYVSNALGTVNPVREIIQKAHSKNIPVMIDAAQAIHHIPIDVQELDCDFMVFSGHKMYAPTGSGVFYGKEDWLNKLQPYQGGGEMIKQVSFEGTTFNELPFKFEAGTPNTEASIGLGAAIDYINAIGIDKIQQYESQLMQYATEKLSAIEGMKIYGTAKHKSGVISFLVDNIHPFDMGTMLDKMGIAVRTGHHCTQPLMKFFDIPGTVRASFALYNTREDVDALVSGIQKIKQLFG